MSGLGNIRRRVFQAVEEAAKAADRVAAIYEGANPVQRCLIDDQARMIGAVCPRRSGKTFAVTSKVLHFAEKFPGARILIISLTLKSTVENYWASSPGGLWAQNQKYELSLKFNTTSHSWVHTNGSRGLLAGAETKADIEHLRGAAAEADIVIIDECKSFAPSHLQDLIDNVVIPGLMTRQGQLVLIGTPGSIPLGPFYDATCLRSRNVPEGLPVDAGRPTCIRWQDLARPRNEQPKEFEVFSDDELLDLFSLHTWTIQDNLAAPGQWAFALRMKRRKGWTDDNPTWRREFLGEWVSDTSELVYLYAQAKSEGKCNWLPNYEKFGITGLDPDEGPWHLLMGLDLGFVDESAAVIVAYSETTRDLRHVYDYKRAGLDSQAFLQLVLGIVNDFPPIEMVVADFGGGGARMLVETLNQRYGQSIQPAKKTDKVDHIELMNGDFLADRVKLIPRSDLESEICGLQWDLSNDAKHILARTGRLREDPSCPNHLCDALLYIWRFAYHYFAQPVDTGPEKGTAAYEAMEEAKLIASLVRRKRMGKLDPMNLSRTIKDQVLVRESIEAWKTSYR